MLSSSSSVSHIIPSYYPEAVLDSSVIFPVKDLAKGIAKVLSKPRQQQGQQFDKRSGTGFCIKLPNEEKLALVTNYHVLANEKIELSRVVLEEYILSKG